MHIKHPYHTRLPTDDYLDTHEGLIQAVYDNNLPIIASLLKHAGQQDNHGYTALAIAASLGNYGACKLLHTAEAGIKANITYKLRSWKFGRCTALMMAAWHGHVDIVKLLVTKEAKMRDSYWNVTALMGAAYINLVHVCAALKPHEIGCQSIRGYSALMWAIMGGSKDCFDLLMDAEYKLFDGEALPLAVQHEFVHGVKVLAPLLVEISGKRALQRVPKTPEGETIERIIRMEMKESSWL